MRSVSRRLPTLLGALALLLSAPAEAGHELPFYPSFYPQEIRVEALEPGAAAAQLRSGTLHAYLGADPFGGGRLPANVSAVESLGRIRRRHREPGRAGGTHPREPLRDRRTAPPGRWAPRRASWRIRIRSRPFTGTFSSTSTSSRRVARS